MIAPTRDSRDANGDLYIDGNKKRYGMAEFYVDIPGEASERSVSRKKKITKAWSYIERDSKNGRLTKCKILGKYMNNAPDTDVEDYLYQRAEQRPDEVIELYESKNIGQKLLLIDAKEKGIVMKRDGMYYYGDNVLGATDDAVLITFNTPEGQKLLHEITKETYPEYASVSSIKEKIDSTDDVTPKKVTKK